MGEQVNGSGITVSEKDVHSEADENRYYAERIALADAGKTVWVQRNFEAERGRVLDFYADRQRRGFVEQDDDDFTCGVYIISEVDAIGEPRILTTERLSLEEAQSLLQETLQEQLEL